MTDIENISPEEPEDPELPKSRIKSILEEYEMLSLHKGEHNTLDISTFNDKQKDSLLQILSDNEKNASVYHNKRIDAIKELEIKRIDASIVNQKSMRYLIVIAAVSALFISVLILLVKDQFFVPWLTFLTGLLGGFGIGKLNLIPKSDTTRTNIDGDD